jgi:uncharacterized coiled-coil DUF342 family protein
VSSNPKENSIYPTSGEGRTFTTNTREGGKEAAPDRLGKPGPQNGPESGEGEGSSGEAENHCTPEQEKPVSSATFVALIVEALRSLFAWVDAWTCVGATPEHEGKLLGLATTDAVNRARDLRAVLPPVPDGDLDARLEQLAVWLQVWAEKARHPVFAAREPSTKLKGAEGADRLRLRGLLRLVLDVVAAGFAWRDYRRPEDSSASVDADLVETANALQAELGQPWNRYASNHLTQLFGEALGRAERARELELKCADLESDRAELETTVASCIESAAEHQAELKAAAQTINTRQATIDELREHLDRAHAEAKEFADKVEALTSKRDEFGRLQYSSGYSSGLADAKADRDELAGKVDALTSERDALSEQLEELRATAGIYEQGAHEEEHLSSELSARVKSLEAELDRVRRKAKRWGGRILELTRQRNRLQAEYLSNLTERGKFASDLAAMLEEYETRAESLERTRERHEVLQNRYADLERACTALREELDEAHRTAEYVGCVKEDLHAKIGDLCPSCVTELIDVGREALKAWRAWSGDKRRGDMACWWERTVDLRSQCDKADDRETNLSCTHTGGGAS